MYQEQGSMLGCLLFLVFVNDFTVDPLQYDIAVCRRYKLTVQFQMSMTVFCYCKSWLFDGKVKTLPFWQVQGRAKAVRLRVNWQQYYKKQKKRKILGILVTN